MRRFGLPEEIPSTMDEASLCGDVTVCTLRVRRHKVLIITIIIMIIIKLFIFFIFSFNLVSSMFLLN